MNERDSIAEALWRMHRQYARDEYLATDVDIDQLARDFSALTLLVHQLVALNGDAEVARL